MLAVATAASAQSPYVGASLVGDITRVSHSVYDGSSGEGETFAGALRVGTSLGQQWGVELEFARSGKVDATPEFSILADTASFTFGDTPIPSIFPVPQIEAERQLSTIATLLWWSHDVSSRVSLVYLGGVAFTREKSEIRISYGDFILPPGIPGGILPPPRSIDQESVSYGADVAVGFEGRIGMTEHLHLTPGIRLHTISSGWSIRPGVGLQWRF